MASPPKKKQRRAIVLDSDDEEASAAESQLSTATLNVTTKKLSIKKESGTAAKRQAARRKVSSISKTKHTDTKAVASKSSAISRNTTIYSFFNNASQNSSQGTIKPKSPLRDVIASEHGEAIEEISSDEGNSDSPGIAVERHRPVRATSKPGQFIGSKASPALTYKAKQFSTVANQVAAAVVSEDAASSGSWIDLYPPETLDELVVHKRKVADVHRWLDNVVQGRERKRLLVLKGPSGSGKTATLRVLAKEVGRRLIEWENPVGSSYDSDGFTSLAAQFDDFLVRTSNFQGLELSRTGITETIDATETIAYGMVLLEDFPNIFSRGSTALLNFRDSMLRYLAASTPTVGSRASGSQITPVVMIVSETHMTSSSNYTDSFTVSKLLGPQLLQHPNVTIIEFNPIAPTLLSKALSTILRKENKSRTKHWSPSSDVFKQIIQSGDLRTSINSLQLACMFDNVQTGTMLKSTTESSRKKTVASRATTTPLSNPSVAFRDDIIDLFHAAGKILYNKRKDPSSASIPLVQPPFYLSHYARPKESEVSIEQLHADIGTDIGTYVSTLHENYPPSCFGEDFLDSIDDCMSTLSDADLLLASGIDFSYTGRTTGRAPASIIQTEYAFNVASRGLLFSLPHPVERGKTLSSLLKINRDPFKMVYPTSLKTWRIIDENENVTDDWIDYLLHAEDTNALTRITRAQVNCEFLPYIQRIMPRLQMMNERNKEKGKAVLNTIDELDEDIESSTTSIGSVLTMPLPPVVGNDQKFKKGHQSRESTVVAEQPQKLVLSDDDIEDD